MEKTDKNYEHTDVKIKTSYSNLNDKKEKKLKYDYKKIESFIEEFLIKYDIDFEIESYIYTKLGEKLNKEIIFKNLDVLLGKLPQKEYQKQLEISQFHEFKNYIETLLKEKIKLELKEIEKVPSSFAVVE